MSMEKVSPPAGPTGVAEFDELQRGQDRPLTVEGMQRTTPDSYSDQSREIPIPHPGERPGALRAGDEPPTPPAD